MSDPASCWHSLAEEEFRLLKLQRKPDGSTGFELSTHSILHAPPFAALSYVCGTDMSATPLILTSTVKITSDAISDEPYDDTSPRIGTNIWAIPITANLKTALDVLSSSDRDSKSFLGYDYFWIDSICINQVDLAEKATQVSSMDKIYSRATEVVVCLGKEEDHSSEALTIIREVAAIMYGVSTGFGHPHAPSNLIIPINQIISLAKMLTGKAPILRSEENFYRLGLPKKEHIFWKALARLYSREWFHRLWTFQEVMLSQKCYVVCGNEGIKWDDLLKVAIGLTFTQTMYVSGADVRMPSNYSGDSPQSFVVHFSIPYDGTGQWFPIHINQTRYREVSEPRDRVYAILSLAHHEVRSRVQVDYEIPLAELYKTFTKALLRHHPPSMILMLLDIRVARTPGLPTWCPDYGQPPVVSLYSHLGDAGLMKEDQDDHAYVERPGSDNAIYLRGARIDSVAAAVATFSFQFRQHNCCGPEGDAAVLLQWLDSCQSLVQRTLSINPEEAERLLAPAIMAKTTAKNHHLDLAYPHKDVEGLQALKMILSVMCASSSVDDMGPQQEQLHQLMQPVFNRLYVIWRGRTFFSTVGGRFGIASPEVMIGDKVCVLLGDTQIYLLRRRNEVYNFVSVAHVTGFSDGKGLPDLLYSHEILEII